MINEQIRDKEIRLIDEEGNQVGLISSRDAQKLADEKKLDLVKIAPNAKPPVCKIMDYGKYRFDMIKKEKEAKKKQKVIEVKELEEEFSMQRSTTLGILKRMCCKGLIEYFPDEHDKRCRIIRPTKKAYDLKKKTDEHKQNLDILMLETLTKDEVKELRCLLNTVLSNLSKEV
jgi:translation initiation factor IF-3